MEALQTINADDYDQRAGGILSLLQHFETFFGLNLSHLIFSAIEQTLRTLQAKDTSIQEALSAVNLDLGCYFCKRQRKDTAYQLFYSSVVLKPRNILMILSCHATEGHQDVCIDDGSAPHVSTSPEECYRAKYFEALDFVENEINRRYDKSSLAVSDGIETFLMKCVNSPVSKTLKFLIPL